jgi:prefoldin subunit 5
MPTVSDERFSEDGMNRLYEYIKMNQDLGQPVDYEILIDGFPMVKRTNDPRLFEFYDKFITDKTKKIEILFYVGASNNNHRHIQRLKDEPKEKPQPQGLSGIEVEQRIQDHIKREKEKWELERLTERNAELEEEVTELETEVEKLEKELDEVKAKESPMKGFLGEFGSTMLESFIRRNPQMLSAIPGGQALAGFIEEDNRKMQESQTEPELKVSFRARDEKPDNKEAVEALGFVNYLKGKFKDDFTKMMEAIELLAENPQKLDSIINDLKEKKNGSI